MSSAEIIDGYCQLKKDFDDSAIGAKDVISAVFFEFHEVRFNAEFSPFLLNCVMAAHLLS